MTVVDARDIPPAVDPATIRRRAGGGIGSLTLRELLEVEEAAKVKLGALDPKRMGARELAAIAWVLRRREEPAFTWDDALSLTMSEVNAIIGGDAEADPTQPSAPNG